ncbi:MAG: restriction endonuclease [Porticoccaceae bacterium]
MTKPNWKKFERLVAAINAAEQRGADVRWNDKINGRQFDVSIRFNSGLYTYLTVIECKDTKDPIRVEKVDAFVTKSRDAKANKAVMVTTSCFQAGCREVAERHGVELLILSEIAEDFAKHAVDAFTPGLNVYDVEFGGQRGETAYEFQDRGGRLAYLMTHTAVNVPHHRPCTPSDLVNQWQCTQETLPEHEAQAIIPLPDGTSLEIPFEDPVFVSEMRFRCKLVELALTSEPFLDHKLRDSLATAYELRDPDGTLRHSARTGELPHGFDTVMEPGKFYFSPALQFFYLCKTVSNGSIRILLIESYQHGQLVQGEISIKSDYARFYMEVEDEGDLQRLERILRSFRDKHGS